MIGTTISHYHIVEKLGEGGMGIVYKAQDTKLNRAVALKFLPERVSASETDTARFVQEAQAAAALSHPNICTIHGIEEADGKHFIVMEFVDGQTLQERKSGLSLKQAIDIGIQIAEGLAAAHEKGIVHRDIKPDNIMIRKDGIVQIMDFGLAKLQGVSRLTKEGSTVGTAGYMSPEQIQGQDADYRSDIFSMGVLLYELLTNQLPFKGMHETALAYEIVNVDPAPMSSVKPEIDPVLDSIVLECLEKDPNERTQSARQVSLDLKRFKRESSRQLASRIIAARPITKRTESGESATPSSFLPKQWIWPGIAVFLMLAWIVSAWLLWPNSHTAQAVARLSISLPKDQAIQTGSFTALAISPDGSRLVYRANGRLYQRRLNSFELEEIPGTDDGSSPFFSPDGKWIGFFASGKLKKISLSGGSSVDLAENVNDNRGGTWSSDGTIVYEPLGNAGLYRVSADGGSASKLTTLDTLQGERTHRWPQFLPDGKNVIFTIGAMDSPDYYEDATIGVANMKTGEHKVILRGASRAEYVAAGFLIYSRSGSLFACRFDLDHLKIEGSSFPIADNLSGDQQTGATNFDISGNGTLAWVPGQTTSSNRELAFADLDGSVASLPLRPGQYFEPSMSPDGKNIALVIESGKDYDIWIYNIPNNTMNRFTFGGPNRTPVWSPDGKRIAYSYNGAAKLGIMVKQADGTGPTEEFPITKRTYVNGWSSDGSTLLLSVPGSGTGWDIYTLPLNGDKQLHPWLATKFDEYQASVSPDGKWIAYRAREGGVGEVYVRPYPRGDGKWQVSTGGANEAHWSPDGKTLYYARPGAITAVPIDGSHSFTMGRPHVVLQGFDWIPIESAETFDISPDGRHILITRAKEGSEAPGQINVVQNWFDELKTNLNSGK